MKNLLNFYFDMFDSLITKKFNGKLTADFEKKIDETKEKIKDTLNDEMADYTELCLTIDKEFEEYISSKK